VRVCVCGCVCGGGVNLVELLPFHVFESVPQWSLVLIVSNSLKLAHVHFPPAQSKCGLWCVPGNHHVIGQHANRRRSEFIFVCANARQNQGLGKSLVTERALC
jgi:hypothetical protein